VAADYDDHPVANEMVAAVQAMDDHPVTGESEELVAAGGMVAGVQAMDDHRRNW
jgi:hypothetical protein